MFAIPVKVYILVSHIRCNYGIQAEHNVQGAEKKIHGMGIYVCVLGK